MRTILFYSSCLVALAGCAQFPDVDAATDPSLADTPYPALLPVEQVLDQDPARLDENSEAALQYRINRLKKRAADLQATPEE